MTLDSPLPTARADHEPPYVVGGAANGEKDAAGVPPFHLAPPWKQMNSISVESLFTPKSDLSQQMSPPYSHQTLTTTSVPSSAPGSTPNTSTVGSARDPHMKFPLTNGSLFTVGADGRYPVMRNYRRGSNGGHRSGRIGLRVVTNPRCDPPVLPLPSTRHGGHVEDDLSTSNNENNGGNINSSYFGGPPPRSRPCPMVEPLERQTVVNRLEESDSELEEEPIYATLSSLEEDDEGEDIDEEEEDRAASPMSSCSVTTAANDDFEYRDAKGAMATTTIGASNCRQEENASNGDDTEIEEVIFRLPERSAPSALGLYRLRLDEEDQRAGSSGDLPEAAAASLVGGGSLIRSPHNFHRRRYRRVPGHQHHGAARRLGGAGIVLSVDSLQTALSRPDAVAYLDNGERMSGSVPDFKKVFVSEFI